jgi:hypothetical protein
LLAYPDQILAVKHNHNGDTADHDYLRNFTPIGGYLGRPIAVQHNDGLHHQEVAQENWETTFMRDFDDNIVEYRKNADYEIYYNEEMFFFVKQEDAYIVDHRLQEGYSEYKEDMIVPERFIVTNRAGMKIVPDEVVQGKILYEE